MTKHLVIVESPTKAKTIKRFLGKDYRIEASMGHVRDLPEGSIGVNTKTFLPEYEVPDEKKTVVQKLKKAFAESDELWIATDEDREGEAIGWHLTQVLKADTKETKRIVFHEITEPAIREAVENPRTIDANLVDAQQARRVLDRLVGYTLSPFLWRKVHRGLSAGRVQSVAVRIIVDREREIRAFVPVEYWTIEAALTTEKKEEFTALLKQRDGKPFVPSSEAESKEVLSTLKGASYQVSDIEEKDVRRNPAAPFTTSTLQQEAARKLGFSVKQTMVVAQQLYEGIDLGKGEGPTGLITYMRTDSVHLSEKALTDARDTIQKLYGREYILTEPRTYKTKSKGAQEAHEAIRPTEISRTPQSLADVLDRQQLKLYTLIWNRTVATQMPAAEFRRIAADIAAKNYTFRATGQTVVFDGFMRVYSEGRDESDDARRSTEDKEEDGTKILPPLAKDESLECSRLTPEQHFTKPPPRYTEASLVKKLEEEGIGRPSTYAPVISTIQQRGYIKKDGSQLVPEEVAFTVTDLLVAHFPDIADLTFTAQMEQSLDTIAEGGSEWKEFLAAFYGPFHELITRKGQEIKKEDVLKERIIGTDPATGLPVLVRAGRFGPYLQLGKPPPKEPGVKRKTGELQKWKTASLPKNLTADGVTLEQALGLLVFPRDIGIIDGETLTVQSGRFGPYLKCGSTTVSLPEGYDPATLTLEQAKEAMSAASEKRKKAAEPLRTLGTDPATGAAIQVKDGRFGPYVSDGKTNASLGKKFDASAITLEEAAELLAKKRLAPKRAWGRKKK